MQMFVVFILRLALLVRLHERIFKWGNQLTKQKLNVNKNRKLSVIMSDRM
jgi:hypothetical protein